MGLFDKIKSAIFGEAEAAPSAARPAAAKPAPTSAAPPQSPQASSPGSGSSSSPPPAASTAPAPASPSGQQAQTTPKPAASSRAGNTPQVDVGHVLTELASKRKEKLDWRRSIVDLMKLLDLDSSLSARKELAKELNYTGDTNDSASMNVWLHKQVMRKLAENGGKVPEDLRN
jgi:hypothetical protein